MPEIQEVLSLNQAQTKDQRVNDGQKTVEISEITLMFARGIWIAFMSNGGSFTNESGININPDAIGMASETDIRTSVYCHMVIVGKPCVCLRKLNGTPHHRVARQAATIRLPVSKVLRRGNVKLQSSLLFDSRSNQGISDLVRTAEAHCQATWSGDASTAWDAKCEVVVHATMAAYCGALGPGSERTSGCSTIQLDKGRILLRRIDLCGSAEGCFTDSLPHELTHVVLADQFTDRRIPQWADEGIAMLAESADKLQRRLNELQGLVAMNHTMGLHELMKLDQSPPASSRGAFMARALLSPECCWNGALQSSYFVSSKLDNDTATNTPFARSMRLKRGLNWNRSGRTLLDHSDYACWHITQFPPPTTNRIWWPIHSS